jgi:dinuclear metal center YbgI/SA1388 family protein
VLPIVGSRQLQNFRNSPTMDGIDSYTVSGASTMSRVAEIAEFLESFAPTKLAEAWDNVGLLVGDPLASVERIMTCLTITPTSTEEAIAGGANLIVAHHPLPFRPLNRLTTATPEGRMLLDLIAARVAVYSPHTAFDSAAAGINQQLATGLELADVQVLAPAADGVLGSGRFGQLRGMQRLDGLANVVKQFLKIERVQVVGTLDREVRQVAVACGSAGEFLTPAREAGCDCLVTGEVRFHTALEAESTGISLILAGHYASERFGVEALAGVLAKQFPTLHVWASREEADPLGWF